MKSNILYYAKKYKRILFMFILLALFVYSINSVFVIYNWLQKSTDTNEEYEILKQQNTKILEEIELLKFKTAGLKEETLNKDILETQAKSALNVARAKEIIIIH
ncbi:MAG: hypothetical protein LBH40_03765 [Alphaproteobacteria bacterium]|jgi:cell division protein FtsB|nr:hypothetical protein [Alphaproteobacteria bacterium]